MKTRKTIITASEAIIITIWMRIRMIYEEEKNNPIAILKPIQYL